MNSVVIPLSDELRGRLTWLCGFYRAVKPLRLFIINKPYFTTTAQGLSFSVAGFSRNDSIFLFPGIDENAADLEQLSRTEKVRLAKDLAHEFRHFLDWQSLWIVTPYPKREISTQRGKVPLSWSKRVWAKILNFFTYTLNPLEIRANWHSFTHWKNYYYILWGEPYSKHGMIDWLLLYGEWKTQPSTVFGYFMNWDISDPSGEDSA